LSPGGSADAMRALFLSGPLAWPPLLDLVAGAPLSAGAKPAALDGARVQGAKCCFPPLLPMAGGRAEGLLIHVEAQEHYDRLSFFAETLGRAPVPKHLDDGRAAVAFMGTGTPNAQARAFYIADWAARWGSLALLAATEIMGYFGHEPAGALHWRVQMILARAGARIAASQAAPARLRSDTAAEDVMETTRRDSHAGFFVTREYELRHPGFDGQMSPLLRREVFVATDAAIVLPYNAARDRVLLVEQFRMGPYGRGDPRPFVLEPVAGRVDAGETPEDAALRECKEEAALDLAALEHVTSHYCSPGCSTEFYHCYLGLADLPEKGQGCGGVATENEDIRTHVLGFEQAMRLITTGEANVGPLVLMLLWLQRERARLRAIA